MWELFRAVLQIPHLLDFAASTQSSSRNRLTCRPGVCCNYLVSKYSDDGQTMTSIGQSLAIPFRFPFLASESEAWHFARRASERPCQETVAHLQCFRGRDSLRHTKAPLACKRWLDIGR